MWAAGRPIGRAAGRGRIGRGRVLAAGETVAGAGDGPYPYLDAWRRGEQRSPVDEVDDWVSANPTACADAMADPFAPDA